MKQNAVKGQVGKNHLQGQTHRKKCFSCPLLESGAERNSSRWIPDPSRAGWQAKTLRAFLPRNLMSSSFADRPTLTHVKTESGFNLAMRFWWYKSTYTVKRLSEGGGNKWPKTQLHQLTMTSATCYTTLAEHTESYFLGEDGVRAPQKEQG